MGGVSVEESAWRPQIYLVPNSHTPDSVCGPHGPALIPPPDPVAGSISA